MLWTLMGAEKVAIGSSSRLWALKYCISLCVLDPGTGTVKEGTNSRAEGTIVGFDHIGISAGKEVLKSSIDAGDRLQKLVFESKEEEKSKTNSLLTLTDGMG